MNPEVLVDYDFSVATGRYAVRALLRLSGRAPSAEGRIPLNLSVVLDRSGSMNGAPLAAARDAAALLVERLFPEDVVSVVAYDDRVETVAEPATGPAQRGLAALIGAIQSRGSTNLSGGWLRGRELVASGLRPGGVNRVLLLTDGHANVGVVDPERLAQLCADGRAAGITTTTIGFAAGYDEHLLQAMADGGGGHMYYIERPDQAPAVFQEEIEGLLTLSAQNIAVEIRPLAGARVGLVHHTYPARATGEVLRLELGDLYAREPKQLLVEFEHAGQDGPAEIAELVLTADVLRADGGMERQEIRLVVRTELDRAGREEPEVRRELLAQGAARARQEALDARRRGDLEAGERALRRAARDITSAPAPYQVGLGEEVEDLERMAGTFLSGAVSELDAKYVNQRAHDLRRSKLSGIASYSRSRRNGGIQYRPGDATQPEGAGRKIVVHLADVHGEWGTGFGRAVSQRWPDAEARYHVWRAGADPATGPFEMAGVQVLPVEPDVWVATLIAKERPAGVPIHPQLRYDALDAALVRLSSEAAGRGASAHMPRIGCGVGGGDWDQVARLVERRLCGQGVPVTVYG